jgi:CRISPR/Cas system-associated endonuclease Cas1
LEKQLVITDPYIFLGLSGELVVIKKKQILLDVIPVRRISEIIVRGDSILSAALIRRCIECDIVLFIRLTSGYTIPVIKSAAS